MKLDELKKIYYECRIGIAEWAQTKGADLDSIIEDGKKRDGAVALEILEAVSSDVFTDIQLNKLFELVVFWIQGPSKFYGIAIQIMLKHSRVLIQRIESQFSSACKNGDDSLVRGFCHAFSLMDLDLQIALSKKVVESFAFSNSDVREAICDLTERCRAFSVPKGNDTR
jgi:hypothetical protein